MLRVAFIGAGRIADMHYEGYRNNPKARLYAVCDSDSELLQQRASQWGVEKTYDDYRRLLDDPEIDAVEIVTPHHLHKQMAIDALNAGKHVSVQKPMALSVADADAMIAAAERSGMLFRVIENYRYYAPFNKAKELMDEGAIGEPLSIRIKSLTGNAKHGWDIPTGAQGWRSDPAQSGEGSVIFDHGQHIWSIARYFLGDVESTFAFMGREKVEAFHELQPGSLLDNPTMASWKYRGSDTYGSWEGVYSDDMVVRSKYYPIYVWAEITGTNGILWVNHFIGNKLDRPPLEMYRDGEMTVFNDLESDYATSFARAGHDFADAILEGRQSDLTGPEGREVLRFSLAVIRSGRERREVKVDEITD
jgi:predicted dehydrogenase